LLFHTLKCNVFFLPQIMLAVGLDITTGNPVNVYTGQDYSAAKDAVDAAGQSGTILKDTSLKIRRRHSPCATVRVCLSRQPQVPESLARSTPF
jgi:hypothetical protein